jgi:superoxide dismutase, Fe-Mn family
MAHTLMPLPYPFNALEPHIDAKTVEIHHDKHHAAYVTNLNKALEKHPELSSKSIEELIGDLASVPDDIRAAVRNNSGGALNHNLFWQTMSANAGGRPSGDLAKAVERAFGSFDAFKEKLSAAAVGQFGSGWAFLFVDGAGKLDILATPGHDTPLMTGVAAKTGRPILVVDVWEHAYYLKYQNRRADFVAAWWNLVNWGKVAELYAKAL